MALDDVRERLDVLMRVQWPLGPGDDAVVVEHTQRADAELVRVAVAIEREVPAGVEPAALFVPDRVRASDLHCRGGEAHRGLLRRAQPKVKQYASTP